MRRVVVTGIGMVTPLGCGVETTWRRLVEGQSGASRIERFDVSDLPCKIACMIPRGDGSDGTYNPDQWMEPKDQRKVDDFIIYAMCAARQATRRSRIGSRPIEEDQAATGTMIGSGIGGIEGISDTAILLHERGPAPGLPVLHSRPADQSRLRLCLDRVRAQGTQPCRRHRLLDRARMRSATPAGSSRSATPT